MDTASFQPPNDHDLREQALQGLKQMAPTSYRRLLRENDVEGELDRMVARYHNVVSVLTYTGIPAPIAWDWARREVLALRPQS